ncbi:hypothetical protein VFPFJ_04465 [Purpureocillium lilacinum]|uniref:Uncharacterized protein n=1 Tax=Purpureocillium lilacinum TaxID=33203 RepID=A0A179HIN7_PURLI|nr:hypothetical protein VFPFJ_04465 [Purpureocillium lilacinum]OAQ83524.1 hypothetical protein VFPBJ_02292 [Purpureocillium lilacinum]OAQ90306.1 hypothetical protein VFPFJ_04465 [Purpureocillium lilacinum]
MEEAKLGCVPGSGLVVWTRTSEEAGRSRSFAVSSLLPGLCSGLCTRRTSMRRLYYCTVPTRKVLVQQQHRPSASRTDRLDSTRLP